MKKILPIIMLIIIFILSFCVINTQAELYNGLFDLSFLVEDIVIYKKLPDNTIKQSISVLHKLIQKDPYNIELYIALANNYNKMNRYEDALTLLKEASFIDANYSSLYLAIGETHDLMGNKDDAIYAFEKMVEVDYLNYKNHFTLGMAYLRRHNFSHAQDEFNKTIEINPFSASAYYYLGLIALQDNNFEQALVLFSNAVKLQPAMYQALNNIGVIYQKHKQDNESSKYFTKSIEFNPNYDIGNFNLGRLLLKRGNYQEAKEKLEISLSQNKEREKTYYLLGLICEQLNQIMESVEYFKYLSEHYPENISYTSILAQLYTRMKDYKSAEQCYVSLLGNNKVNAYILVNYGIVLEKLKMNDEASVMYKDAIRQRPTYTRAHMLLAKYYLRKFQFSNTFKELLKSGNYLYSSIMIIILVSIFVIVVCLSLKIFFHH